MHSPINKVRTWSPATNSVTSCPTLSIILDASWPNIRGNNGGWALESQAERSERQREVLTTLIRISEGCGGL
ncbi:hypothetical protein Tco_0621232, partial [Tanacetum coccineum]